MLLAEIANLVGGELAGDGSLDIQDVAEYEKASPTDLSYVDSAKRLEAASGAGALIVPQDVRVDRPSIRVENPRLAFARAVSLLRPPRKFRPGIHPGADIAGGARLGKGVHVGPFASIAEGAVVGDGCYIGAGAHIGENVRVGAECVLHPNCVLYADVEIGARVILHAGAIVGADGFGYMPDEDGRIFKYPQTGRVVIEDDVEVGANTTIDRATLGETRIGRGTKIDNLVQIAHNVTIGENCLLAAQVGVAGSARIGRGVVMGGGAGVSDHVEIGDGATLGGRAGALWSLEGGKTYHHYPAAEAGDARRRMVALRNLPKIAARINRLEKRMDELES